MQPHKFLTNINIMAPVIIHQIFSLTRDWSKRVMSLNIWPAKIGEYSIDIPQFSKLYVLRNNIW